MWQSFADFWREASQGASLFPLEAGIVLAMLVLLAVRRRSLLPASWWSAYLRFAAHRKASVALVFAFTLVGHFLAEPGYVKPVPGIHDEFSYLLAADTFLNGRLANPPHPMRYFFETFHVLVEPSYVSMYPPGQGLALAAGLSLTGDEMAAVWLTAAAMCAAICWMLQGWLRPHWALTAGLLCAVRIGWFSYWANSYWGGAVGAIGGALLGGAVLRLIRKPGPGAMVTLIGGILILANTRPYEGAAFSLAALAYLAYHGRRYRLQNWVAVSIPALILAAAGAGFMMYYNWRGTGDPLRPPYLENRAQYQIHGSFYWNKSNFDRTFHHEVMERFYKVHEEYTPRRTNFWRWPDKPLRFWLFFVGPALTLTLLGMATAWRTTAGRFAIITIGALFAAHLPVVWDLFPHYAAPITGAYYLLLFVCLRGLKVSWRGGRLPGNAIYRAVLLTCFLMVPLRSLAPKMGYPVFGEATQTWYNYGRNCNFFRARIEDRFTSMGGKHLILVQYDPLHPPEMEWVYNKADIDTAPVVWARYVPNPTGLAQLLSYYKDRRIWIIFPDRSPNQIFDYKEHFR